MRVGPVAGSRCLNGGCQDGTTGKGCAVCDQGYFTAGTTCQRCPDSLALLIPVAIVALIAVGFLLYFVWKVSSVNLSRTDADDTDSREKVEEVEDAVAAAAGAASSIARISNTAIITSISLPAIFQISLTFELPFAYVCYRSWNYMSVGDGGVLFF